MKNYIQPGDVVNLVAPYDRNPGQGALVGIAFGVAMNTVASGVRGEFSTKGCYALDKATGAAWTEGAAIYWDNTAKNCTTTSSGNTKIGIAIAQFAIDGTASLPASGDVTGAVRLNGAF